MNSRTLVALLACLAVLVALAIAVSISQHPATTSNGPFLPELKDQLNNVSKIVVRTGGNKTIATLERQKDGWVVMERGQYPADVGRIRKNLIALADARLVEEKTSNPETYDRLKVDDIEKDTAAGVRLDITAGEKTTSVIVGTTGVGGGERAYARRAGEPTSWLVSGAFDLPSEPADWLDRLIADIPGQRVRAVTITHPDGSVVRVQKESPDAADFKIMDIPAGRELSFQGVADTVGIGLADLRLDGVEPAAGFMPGDVKPVVTRFETFDGLVVEATTWRLPRDGRLRLKVSADQALAVQPPPKSGEAKAADAKPAKAETAPAATPRKTFDEVKAEAAELQARVEPWVYAVPGFKADQLSRRMNDLLAPKTQAGPPKPKQ